MNARLFLNISLIILIAGVFFSAAVFVLPNIKTPQTYMTYGPNTPYGNLNYTISGYFFPPIDAGQQISVTLFDFEPNSISMSLFPSGPSSVSPTGPPLVYDPNVVGPIFHVVVDSPADQAYGIYISSLNRTKFTMEVSSTWTLFYPLRGYLPVGFFLILLGGVGSAHFYQEGKREEEYERVVKEAQSRKE